jgi:hypothetical protein
VGHPEVTANMLSGGTWTRERWTTLLRNVLPNDTLADAAMWMGSTPLRVNVSRGVFFVALRVATP